MNSIVFENVCKSYGDAKIVKSLNLEIKEGERLILLGPSGCGKTTTLRMIAGLEDITSGQLKMGGRVVNDIAPGERNIAMVFQSYALFPHLSVWDNITFGLHIQKLPEAEIKKRADEALEILNLRGYENYKPKQLSGGQKQRLATADALAGIPECLVLDEPTAMLDPSSRKEVINIVKELNQKEGMTIILITHHTDEVVDADRIILMKDGKIIGDDTPKKIFADHSLLKSAKMDIPPVVELSMRLKKQNIGLDEPVLHEQEMIRKITELYRSKCGGWKDAAR